jgi:hypothetical protein
MIVPNAPALAVDAIDASTLDPDHPSKRWLLLCCGLAGDDLHHERLTDACNKIIDHCDPVLGISNERLRVLAGDEPMISSFKDRAEVELCTRENIETGMQWLATNADQRDETWVIFLGHAHLYGNRSQFNIPDRDIDQNEFATLAKQLTQQRQIFILATPVSGFWIKPLAKPNRIVITATEPSLEITGTEMPYAIANLLANEAEHQTIQDIDGDGVVSLLDFYLGINLEIEATFRTLERLQTEHAQLDDNGDGKGSEVQSAYLPIVSKADKSVSKPELPRPITAEVLDGFLSRKVLLKSP